MPIAPEYTLGLQEIRKFYRRAIKAVGTTLNRGVILQMQGSYNGDEEARFVRIPNARGTQSLGFQNSNDGIEYRTDVLTNLSLLEQTFNHMEGLGWSYQRSGYTRVLVSIDDHSTYDKLKLWWFAKHIEPIMFTLVNGHRKGQNNAKDLPKYVEYLFTTIQVNPHDALRDVTARLEAIRRSPIRASESRTFQWQGETNAYWCDPFVQSNGSQFVAFNLFHSARNVREAQIFALISHNLVSKVKEMTFEELQEAVSLIYTDTGLGVGTVVARLLDGIGIPPFIPTRSRARMEELNTVVSARLEAERERVDRYRVNSTAVENACRTINNAILQAQGVTA